MKFLCMRSFLVLLSTCRILHIHHNAAVFTEIEKKKRDCYLLCFFVLRKKNVKKRGNRNLMKDLSRIFIFLPINSGLSSKKRWEGQVSGAPASSSLVPPRCTGLHLPTHIQSFVWTSCLWPHRVAGTVWAPQLFSPRPSPGFILLFILAH